MGLAVSQPSVPGPKRSVVVVGGGYAGVAISQELERQGFQVTLIEKKDYFLHSVGSLRAVYHIGWENKVVIPYTNLLRQGKVIQGEVLSILPDEKTVVFSTNAGELAPAGHGEQRIGYDFLVVATGSPAPPAFPAQPPPSALHREQYIQAVSAYREAVKGAKKVVIIGGGPAGVELAAEIAEGYGGEKELTIIHSGKTLLSNSLPPLTPEMTTAALQRLAKQGIRVLLEEKVDLLKWNSIAKEGSQALGLSYHTGLTVVTTSKGSEVQADIVINCIGSAGPMNGKRSAPPFLPAAWLDEQQRVRVNNHLQVSSVTEGNVFALGDVTALLETKLAYYIKEQVPIVSRNILLLSQEDAEVHRDGGNSLSTYNVHERATMALALGSKDGLLQANGKYLGCLGSFMITQAKSKQLMVSEQWKTLGLSAPSS